MAMIVAISVPAALAAQVPTVKPISKPTTTCGPLALIMVTVVDVKGAPVTDATLEVKRQRDGKVVPGAMVDTPANGEYVVMDDTSLPLVPAVGANFVVRAKRGKQTGSTVLRIARSDDGCHVRRADNTGKLVIGK
jgi:hypothetical protein